MQNACWKWKFKSSTKYKDGSQHKKEENNCFINLRIVIDLRILIDEEFKAKVKKMLDL